PGSQPPSCQGHRWSACSRRHLSSWALVGSLDRRAPGSPAEEIARNSSSYPFRVRRMSEKEEVSGAVDRPRGFNPRGVYRNLSAPSRRLSSWAAEFGLSSPKRTVCGKFSWQCSPQTPCADFGTRRVPTTLFAEFGTRRVPTTLLLPRILVRPSHYEPRRKNSPPK